MAEQEDALGSKPGSSKEYEFDSHQGDRLAGNKEKGENSHETGPRQGSVVGAG